MSFSQLPKVLHQLLMHCCDQSTLFALARCCHATLLAASCDFAFKCLPPIVVCSLQPHFAESVRHSLIRFCDLHVRWLNPPLSERPCDRLMSQSAVDWLTSSPRVLSLDGLGQYSAIKDLVSLPPRQGFARLRSVMCHAIPFSTGDWLASLQSLRELTILDISSSDLFSVLPKLVHLTSLQLSPAPYATVYDAAATTIGRCVGLRRLHLHRFHLQFLPLIIHEGMTELEEFSLDASFRTGHVDDLYACFSSAPKLQTIKVLSCHQLPRLLTELCNMSPDGPLRSLVIQPFPADHNWPVVLLSSFLAKFPKVSVALELWQVAAPSEAFNPGIAMMHEHMQLTHPADEELIGRDSGQDSHATLITLLEAARAGAHRLRDVDPHRVRVLSPALTTTRLARNEEIVRRFLHPQQ